MKSLFKVAKILVFVIAIVLLFGVLRNGFNSHDLKAVIATADYRYLFLSIFITAIGLVLKGHRLQILANQFEIKNTIWESVRIQLISITFALITPGRAGEFTKIFLLSKDRKDLIPATTLICIFERLMDFLMLALMGLLLCLLAMHDSRMTLLMSFAAIGFAAAIAVLFRIELFIDKLDKFVPAKVKDFLKYFIEHKPKLFSKLIIIVLYTAVIWCFDGLFQWTILKSVGSDIPILTVIGINSIVVIMSILTVLPMGLGTADFSALFLYNNILHIPKEKIVFLLGSSRLFTIATLLVMLLPTIIMQKDFLAKLYRDTLKRNKVIEKELEEPAS